MVQHDNQNSTTKVGLFFRTKYHSCNYDVVFKLADLVAKSRSTNGTLLQPLIAQQERNDERGKRRNHLLKSFAKKRHESWIVPDERYW
jgi:hypothetical protein